MSGQGGGGGYAGPIFKQFSMITKAICKIDNKLKALEKEYSETEDRDAKKRIMAEIYEEQHTMTCLDTQRRIILTHFPPTIMQVI